MTYYIIATLIACWMIGGICRKLQRKNKIVHVIEDNCTGCRRCLKICRRHVLEMASDKEPPAATVVNPDKCSACGDCVTACKFNALEIIKRK